MQLIKYIVSEVNEPSSTTIKGFNDTVYLFIDRNLKGKQVRRVLQIIEVPSPIIETYIIED